MPTKEEFNDDWTEEQEKKFQENQVYFEDKLMRTSPYDIDETTGMKYWDGFFIKERMEQVFKAAQETVTINGKVHLIYKNLDHYLETQK